MTRLGREDYERSFFWSDIKTSNKRQHVGPVYAGPCLRQLTICSVTEILYSPEQIYWMGVWFTLLMPRGGFWASGLPKQTLKTQDRSFPSSYNKCNMAATIGQCLGESKRPNEWDVLDMANSGDGKWKWKLLSNVQLFSTPWTVAH